MHRTRATHCRHGSLTTSTNTNGAAFSLENVPPCRCWCIRQPRYVDSKRASRNLRSKERISKRRTARWKSILVTTCNRFRSTETRRAVDSPHSTSNLLTSDIAIRRSLPFNLCIHAVVVFSCSSEHENDPLISFRIRIVSESNASRMRRMCVACAHASASISKPVLSESAGSLEE